VWTFHASAGQQYANAKLAGDKHRQIADPALSGANWAINWASDNPVHDWLVLFNFKLKILPPTGSFLGRGAPVAAFWGPPKGLAGARVARFTWRRRRRRRRQLDRAVAQAPPRTCHGATSESPIL